MLAANAAERQDDRHVLPITSLPEMAPIGGSSAADGLFVCLSANSSQWQPDRASRSAVRLLDALIGAHRPLYPRSKRRSIFRKGNHHEKVSLVQSCDRHGGSRY